jgi:hypothetical protein
MLLGDSGVGKTCLLVRFKDDTFLSGSFIATVGIDFRNKIIVINDKQVKLQIYDTVCKKNKRKDLIIYFSSFKLRTEMRKYNLLFLLNGDK